MIERVKIVTTEMKQFVFLHIVCVHMFPFVLFMIIILQAVTFFSFFIPSLLKWKKK
jgi:hypothetical protein